MEKIQSNSTDYSWEDAQKLETFHLSGEGEYTYLKLGRGILNLFGRMDFGTDTLFKGRWFKEASFSLGGFESMKGFSENFFWGRSMGYGRVTYAAPVLQNRRLSVYGVHLDRVFIALQVEKCFSTQASGIRELKWGRSANLGVVIRMVTFYNRVVEQSLWGCVPLESSYEYRNGPRYYWEIRL